MSKPTTVKTVLEEAYKLPIIEVTEKQMKRIEEEVVSQEIYEGAYIK